MKGATLSPSESITDVTLRRTYYACARIIMPPVIQDMKIKAIVTGATGMVGEGVLLECLNDPEVEAVLAINRRPGGVSHAKLREVIVADFFQLGDVEAELGRCNACFFCLGVSSVGLSKQAYQQVTYDLTLSVATVLHRLNPEMTFCYVTGAGTTAANTAVGLGTR